MAFFFIPDYLTIFAAKSERMELLDGKETARIIKLEIAQQVKARKAEGKKIPHLAAILVGTDGGSMTYVANKLKSCEECGFESTLMRYDDSVWKSIRIRKPLIVDYPHSVASPNIYQITDELIRTYEPLRKDMEYSKSW